MSWSEGASQGRRGRGTCLTQAPQGYLPLTPLQHRVALTKTSNGDVFYWWTTLEDWGRAYTCSRVEVCCHVQTLIDIRACHERGSVLLCIHPPQLSWSERGFNCLIIILYYPCGPIAWFGVGFSASPHPLLPKRRHHRNSSRWWWRVNWEGLSCCPGYHHWYFCCPNKHHSKNRPWGDTKRWGNKQTEECFDCDVNKINKFSMSYSVKCVCKITSALLLCIIPCVHLWII